MKELDLSFAGAKKYKVNEEYGEMDSLVKTEPEVDNAGSKLVMVTNESTLRWQKTN